MTTTTFTQNICDRCGKKEARPDPYAHGTLPDRWVTFTYSIKDDSDLRLELCPTCDKAVSSVLLGTNPPEPEKKPRKTRKDKNVKKGPKKNGWTLEELDENHRIAESTGNPGGTLQKDCDKESERYIRGIAEAQKKAQDDMKDKPIRFKTKVAHDDFPARVEYGDVSANGKGLREALQNMDIALGTTTWRDKLCPADVDIVRNIEYIEYIEEA